MPATSKWSAVGEFAVGAGNNLLQERFRLVVLVFLHGAKASFVGLQQLRQLRIIHERVLGCRFLGHVKKSSSICPWNYQAAASGFRQFLEEWVSGRKPNA